jgi:hypothetical protein
MVTRLLELIIHFMDTMGWTFALLVSGFIGALLSLVSLDGDVTIRIRLVTVGGGIALSWFGAPALGNYWAIPNGPILSGVSFVLGLYGLAIVNELFDFIRSGALKTALTAAINLKLKGSKRDQ